MRVMGPLAAQLEQQAAKYARITSAKQARLGFCHPDIPGKCMVSLWCTPQWPTP